MESSDELRYCVNRQTRKTDDDTTGKHKCGCACDRCVHLANQIPADGHEPWFPVANANEYIPGGAVLGTTRYTLETLWNEFNGIWTKGKHDDDRLNKTPGWRERFEPQVNHIKSCDDFEQKLGKLKAGLAHKAPGALVKGRHTFCGHTKRVWVLDHQLLHKHFETHEEDDDTEAPATQIPTAAPETDEIRALVDSVGRVEQRLVELDSRDKTHSEAMRALETNLDGCREAH